MALSRYRGVAGSDRTPLFAPVCLMMMDAMVELVLVERGALTLWMTGSLGPVVLLDVGS